MGSKEGHRVTGHPSQCIVADIHPAALSKSQAPWIASLIFLQLDWLEEAATPVVQELWSPNDLSRHVVRQGAWRTEEDCAIL